MFLRMLLPNRNKKLKNKSHWRFCGGVMYLPEDVRLKNWKQSIKNFKTKDSRSDLILDLLKKEGKPQD